MANLSLKEIMDVINKSGGTGDAASMQANKMGMQENVTNTLTAQANPAMEGIKQNYLAQLAKVAEMDQKLAGVYGDPTSPLYIERASKRDAAVHMADAGNYKAATTHADLLKQKKQELEDSIKQTMDVYNQLTQLTKSAEAEEERTIKNEARVNAGKGKYVETSTGKKVVVPVYKGKGSSGGSTDKGTPTGTGKLTKEQMNAGFKDYNAANSFSTKEAAFRKQWVDKVQSGRATPPKNGYSQKDLDVRYEAWKKKQPKKKGSSGGSNKQLF